jgi:K+ transporter
MADEGINPEGFFVLGFVFLCTTGAEALYSDMGHCGRKNIRISWIFVKIIDFELLWSRSLFNST